MSRFRVKGDRTKAVLTEQENKIIRDIIATRNFLQADFQKTEISLKGIQVLLGETLRSFALSHKLDLNKNYRLGGEFPCFFLERKNKKPLVKPKKEIVEKTTEEKEGSPLEGDLKLSDGIPEKQETRKTREIPIPV